MRVTKMLEISHERLGALMTAQEVSRFGKSLDLIQNRLKVLNQTLGYGLEGDRGNPFRMKFCKGYYFVFLDDDELYRVRIYDYEEAERCVDRLTGLFDGMWLMYGRRLVSAA